MALRKRKAQPTDPPPSGPESAGAPSDQTELPDEESGERGPVSELDALRAERDEAVESWKRARADYQNLRRRQQADIDSAVARSREGLLAELLLVLDTLEMALATECKTDEAKNLQFGVQMVRHQMIQFLGTQGVTELPEGGVFDPETHQALESVPSPDHSPGDVVETVRRGYRMGDRMLRHAHVKVAADAAAEAASAAPQSDDTSDEVS